MGIQDLQTFLENGLVGGAVSVDLLKIARTVTQRQQPHASTRRIRPIGNKLKLIVDAENCLDRLYGGYFSDWACGGQWNRMVQFLSLLTQAVERGNIELAIVFNGTIDSCRMDEWIAQQANTRQRVGMVLKHVNTKATPPPKVWWTAPICLKTALRMAFRHLGISVMCTMDDHHQEVIAYCREYGFHGLLADDAEYAAFDPPRYFSSEHIKLTYKGSLETKEYMINELTKGLQLTQEQVCVLASLLGNFLLPESELQDIYRKVQLSSSNKDAKIQGETAVKLLAEYVRHLPPISNMDALVAEVFGSNKDKRCHTFKQSVLYYLNGTATGYLKYCTPKAHSNKKEAKKSGSTQAVNNRTIKNEVIDLDASGFASETPETEKATLQKYKLVTESQNSDIIGIDTSSKNGAQLESESDTLKFNGDGGNVNNGTSSSKNTSNIIETTVSADVLRTASLRHQKGLMSEWVLHVLSSGEVRLPCVMEDEANREFPPVHEIFGQLRRRIYAVLFNLHHHRYVHYKKQQEAGLESDEFHIPDIVVREWVYSRANPYQRPEEVKALALPWAVPTLQRLWFGPSVDDKRRRMRALLSCLSSDSPLLLNVTYVPQQMLVMACVLRYILSQEKPVLRRTELDAFLCQAFNPDLMNTQYLQELTLNVVTSRGVQLAAIFMQGVEMALAANDACGAPLPWLMCCPWLYFDGKLFHQTLARAAHAKSLMDLCENRIELVVRVERMRRAILEGLPDAKFAKIQPPTSCPYIGGAGGPLGRPPAPPACLPPASLPSARGPGGVGIRRQHRPVGQGSGGGQLQIAGVVVGQWGANYGYQQQQQQHQQHPRFNQFAVPRVPGGRQNHPHPRTGQPSFPVNKKSPANKKKGNKQKTHNAASAKGIRPQNFTAKTDNNGDVPATKVITDKEKSPEVEIKVEECAVSKGIAATSSGVEQGQGDGPVACS